MKSNSETVVYHSKEEVIDKLEKTYGHQFKEYDVNHRLNNPKNKGALGQVVEEGILGYPVNSRPEADLKNLGIEVKTTGIIKNKSGQLRAKERLTIDSINYTTIVNKDFEVSPVWEKTEDMLLVFYHFVYGIPYGDMRIIKAVLNTFTDEDKEILKKDYEYIISKINEGKAETISEGDTMYLGACTAGTGQLQKQPFSKIKAKQRKFCIKESFFTQLIRKYINNQEFEHITSLDKLKNSTFEIAIESTLAEFYSMNENDIRQKFLIKDNPNAKSRYERYVSKMLGIKGEANNTDEFLKANIILKTIRVQSNNKIEQSMSFPYFEFKDIVKENWEDSNIRNLLADQKFLLAIFKEKNGQMVFDHVQFWNMPETTIDDIGKRVFDEVKRVLLSGNIVREIKKNKEGKEIRYNNFPGMADNGIMHIRPHGRNANDVAELPVQDKLTGAKAYTKQCFWLNNSYVESIIGIKKKQ